MKLHTIFTPAAVVLAIAVASTPAFAGQRDRGARGGERSHSDRAENQGRAVERARPHGDNSPRTESRPETRPQVSVPRAVPRSEVTRPRVDRPVVVAPRVERPVIVSPRFERPRDYRPHYEPRFAPHAYGYPIYRPYVFRPRLHLNFGIWLGYPVPYAYAYPVPVYGYYAPRAPIVVGPESTMYGGVSLEISPSDALVYVDGSYAGTVREFDGADQPLTLAAGLHHIEIQATGYETMTMDVTVEPGQVIPYRGDMRRW
ncbi:MAG: PEGA domain-containing protein [Acidobacteriia bacterium]|nr:PEGA domain-containing protein [Terriglobia bacterium]